jgi:hypothetical protein
MPDKKKPRTVRPIELTGDPEMDEVIRQVNQDRLDGKIKDPPRRKTDCKTLEDLCMYVCEKAHIQWSTCIRKSMDGRISRWCWFGHEFRDKHVSIAEEIAARISNRDELQELRLEATRVSANGAERLRRTFPNARIVVYTDEDYDSDLIPDFHEGWEPEEIHRGWKPASSKKP